MTYWHWTASTEAQWVDGEYVGGEEDTAICEICLEKWTFFEHGYFSTPEQVAERIKDHLEQDHQVQPEAPPFDAETVFDVRERCIVGYEYSNHSRDCDGPLERYGARRFSEGMTWSQYVGREVTYHPPEGFEIKKNGLAYEYGGATEEGYSSTYIEAVFSHEDYKLEQDDRQRDVYAEQMGY